MVSMEFEVAVESSSPCIWNGDHYLVPMGDEDTLIEDGIPYEIMNIISV